MISVDDNKAISFDVELSARDVQDLSSVEGVAAFFAKLGYNTNSRTSQTPGNLGITAEGTTRAIRKIYQLADQESLFKVYLFELTSVTVAHIRALVRAFRTLSGNYLLVLTSDYERLDFVLVERYVPSIGDGGSNIAQKQANVRPRTLTVERRNPSRVQLRVLRRLTWTESDPFAQYDKLLSAYSVADWSEELFNNRALFSDYYLLERLRERSEWKDDPKPPYLCLRDLYRDANSRFAGKEEKILRHDLVEPAFAALGLNSREGKRAGSSEPEPDYQLYSTTLKDSPLALCLVYPWGRSLDGKDYERDTVTADENPGAAVVSLLERGEAPWAVVTNGKVWRLYSQRTHSKATNYYEIDLEEVLAATGSQGDPADAFRYFWLLFRAPAFEPVEILREGKTFSQSFLDQLLSESEDYAKQLGERLKGRVFEQVFPHLASGFLAYARDQNGLVADISDEILQRVFQGTLTLLYRLLFLLYAESRDLLPVKEVRGYWESSLKKLKDEIAKAGGTIEDDVPDHLKKAYRADQYSLYDRLAKLFSVIDRGDASLNVPVYNGGLFLSQPEAGDDTPEAEAARFLNSTKVADRFLARAIDLLARDEDSKRHDLVPIDYKSLGVRHLGSIYEGLLEFKVRIATEKLAAVKQKGREVYKPFSELNDRDRERAERHKRIVKKGEVYLENDKRERKASGSYYTPDFIVKYIVEHAVGPVLREKFEKMRPRLREAQKWNRDMTALARSKKEAESKYDHGPAVELKWVSLVDELFDIKVLDPAMGSGHFLVEAVDFITDKTLDFLNSFPWNPVRAHLIDMRETILRQMEDQSINIDEKRLTDVNLLKRQVLKRCIYGVDLNPMAVELAKVSLWLNCFTLGAPLSFLDHHLRCGNSLIGVSVKEVREAIEGKGITVDASDTRSQFSLFGSRFAGLLLATDLMRHVGEMSDVTSAQVRQSRDEYGKASSALQPFKRILDIYTSHWFSNGVKAKRVSSRPQSPAIALLKGHEVEALINASNRQQMNKAVETLPDQDRQVAKDSLRTAYDKRFFHWELEFPEVFYGPRRGTTQQIERLPDGGFDAIVGNPPYVRIQSLSDLDVSFFSERYEASTGKFDLYLPFIEACFHQLKPTGLQGLIVPNKFLTADYGVGVRRFLGREQSLKRIVDFRDAQVFPGISTYVCLLFLSKSKLAQGDLVSGTRDSISKQTLSIIQAATLGELPWTFGAGELTILTKQMPVLGSVCEAIFQGLITGADKLLLGRRQNGKAYFDGEEFKLEDGIVRPVLRGKDIGRFNLRESGACVIYPYRHGSQGDELFAEDELAEQFPSTYSYLLKRKSALETRGSQSMEYPAWYALWCPRQMRRFESEKLLTQVLASRAAFAHDKGLFWFVGGGNAGVYGIVPRRDLEVSIWYLLGVLNSRPFDRMLQSISSRFRGGYYSYARRFIERVPIRVSDFSSDERDVVNHIEKLAKERTMLQKQEASLSLEREIDDLVSALYDF